MYSTCKVCQYHTRGRVASILHWGRATEAVRVHFLLFFFSLRLKTCSGVHILAYFRPTEHFWQREQIYVQTMPFFIKQSTQSTTPVHTAGKLCANYTHKTQIL